MNRTVQGVVTALLLSGTAIGIASPSLSGASVADASAASDETVRAGWPRVVDDTGTIAVMVPPEWTDLHTSPGTVFDTALPTIRANAAAGEPGISVSVGVYADDLEQQECDEWYRDECEPHEAGELRGYRWYTEECCAGPGRWLTFVGNPTGGQRVTIELTLTALDPDQPDPELLDTIAASVEVLAEPFPADWVVSATELAPPLPHLWPYGDFHDVPQLGTEPVRGSGCGADGSIDETIPDGLWAGTVSYLPDGDYWDVNLLCVYFGDQAEAVLADGAANVVDGTDPDFVIVDNNPRTRLVPNNAQSIDTSFTDVRTDGRCLLGMSRIAQSAEGHVVFAPGEFEARYSTTHQAWVRIHNGAVMWIRFGCDADLWPGPGG